MTKYVSKMPFNPNKRGDLFLEKMTAGAGRQQQVYYDILRGQGAKNSHADNEPRIHKQMFCKSLRKNNGRMLYSGKITGSRIKERNIKGTTGKARPTAVHTSRMLH